MSQDTSQRTGLFRVYRGGENKWKRSIALPYEYEWEEAFNEIAYQGSRVAKYRVVSVDLAYNAFAWEGTAEEAENVLHNRNWTVTVSVTDNTQTQETNMTPDLENPLSIPRTTMIKTLQDNLDKLQKERSDAEDAQTKARQEVLDAIAAFTPDELYNIFSRYYSNDVGTLKFDKDHDVFVTQKVVATAKETDTEKFLRVLNLATDETIEVKPNQELYDLI